MKIIVIGKAEDMVIMTYKSIFNVLQPKTNEFFWQFLIKSFPIPYSRIKMFPNKLRDI